MPVPDPTRFPIEKRFQAALNAMRNPGFLKSPKYEEQQKRALRDGAHPDIIEFERKLVKRFADLGVPVFAHCVIRTSEEQLRLFNEGFSKDTPKDGLWPHKAYAVDIIHSKLGWMDALPQGWQIIGHIGHEVAISMGIKITWGGDWKHFHDPAHFELSDWKNL